MYGVSPAGTARASAWPRSPSVTIGLFYLLAQLVGAGAIAFAVATDTTDTAIILVGILMVVYVLFRIQTTHVQIVVAVLVFGATIFLTVLLMSRFNFSVDALLSAAATASGEGDAFSRVFISRTSFLT